MSKHRNPEMIIPIESDNPSIIRDDSKCVQCGHCVAVCREETTVKRLYELNKTGDRAICVNCGQCAAACPENAITERKEYHLVKEAIANPEKIVIFSTSPAVRVALGEPFGMKPGEYVEGQMVAALRRLGADYVLDTTFAADLTIMEEGAELIERIQHNGVLPQFTSCCPAWVKYVETFHPELIPNISSAKSPIAMQGATIKTYFAQQVGMDPRQIVNVAVAPCTAKKFEIRRPEMNDAARELGISEMRDMDYVITTSELAAWIKEEGIEFAALEPAAFGRLLDCGTGAGVIFGNTGGVMEAAVRSVYTTLTGDAPSDQLLNLTPVRGLEGIKEAALHINGLAVKVAVVHGLNNAKKLIEQGISDYAFIEVMTCPGGCISGAGQPKSNVLPLPNEIREQRIAGLYQQDQRMKLRLSSENPDILKVYKEFYEKPLSEKAERLLHTSYLSKQYTLGE